MKTVNVFNVWGMSFIPFFQSFLILTLLLASGRTASATAYVWTNTLGGNWSVAANWVPNGVPGVADTANISSNGTYTVTVNSAQSVGTLTMNALSGAQTLNLATSGTLTNNGASTGNANAILEVSGGTLTGTGSLILAGPLNWTAGTIKSAVQFSGGTFSGNDFLDGGQLINVGTLTWSSPTIFDGAGSVISNASGATINLTGSGTTMVNNYNPPQTFYNAGQFSISASSPAITIADEFVNSGTTTISAGTNDFTGGGTNNGTISVTASTAALQIDGNDTFNFNTGSTLSDAGNLILGSSAVVNLGGTITVNGTNIIRGALVNVATSFSPVAMTMSSGTLSNNPVTVTGPLNWSGGFIKNVVQCNGGTFSGSDFLDAGQIINTGTMTWNNSSILDGAGSVISNASSGTINVTGNSAFTENEYNPPQTFYNAGLLNISASGTGATFADDFVNTGTTAVNAGIAAFGGGGTNFLVEVGAGTVRR